MLSILIYVVVFLGKGRRRCTWRRIFCQI